MRRRTVVRGIKALYSIPEIAAMLGLTAQSALRWLRRAGILTGEEKRPIFVTLAGIRMARPDVYDSILDAASARRALGLDVEEPDDGDRRTLDDLVAEQNEDART